MQGGGQAVHPEPMLAVDRCSEVQCWDFDPILVGVEACLTKRPPQAVSQAVSEVAQAVDLRLSGLDECGSGQTSLRPSLVEPEQAGGSPPLSQVDFPAIQENADRGGLAISAADGKAPDAMVQRRPRTSLLHSRSH
jgi:hypothetical protein